MRQVFVPTRLLPTTCQFFAKKSKYGRTPGQNRDLVAAAGMQKVFETIELRMERHHPSRTRTIWNNPDAAVTERAIELARQNLPEHQLRVQLWVLQARLGTPTEQADDMAQVRAIAHQLNNIRTIENMRATLVANMVRRAEADPWNETPGKA